jgi:hypothetical protein
VPGYLWANEVNGDANIESCPTSIRCIHRPAKTQRSRQAGTVAQGETICSGARPQPGDGDGVRLDQRHDAEEVTDESVLLEPAVSCYWVCSGITHSSKCFSIIGDVDHGTSGKRRVDYLAPGFVLEISEKCRRIQH